MGRTLLSDAFEVDFDFDVGLTATLILSRRPYTRSPSQKQLQRRRTRVSAPRLRLPVAGQTRIEVKIQGFAKTQLGKIPMRGIQQEIAFSRDHGTRHLQYR